MKKLIEIAVLIMAIAGSVFAQSIPGGVDDDFDPLGVGFESPQSQATQGLFTSAADDFINPGSYPDAEIDSWFAMASFASTNTATLGYAKNFKNLYIGAFYSGSFWANTEKFDYTKARYWYPAFPSVYGYILSPTTVRSYTDLTIGENEVNGLFEPLPSNRIALLIGVANMGFRLSFYTTYQKFNSNGDIILDESPQDYYKSYETEYGNIWPQFAWSMAEDLTSRGVRPYVTFDLNFFRDQTKVNRFYGPTTVKVPNNPGNWDPEDDDTYKEIDTYSSFGDIITRSNNYYQPIVQVGLGGFTLYSNDNFSLSVDFSYRLTMTIYESEYSFLDGNGFLIRSKKIKGRSGFETSNINDIDDLFQDQYITEDGAVEQRFMPSLSGEWSNGSVSLGFFLGLNIIALSEELTEYALMPLSGSLWRNGNDETTTTIGFNPDLRLGLQWRIIPKLALNAGGMININAVSVASTIGRRYNAGIRNWSYEEVEYTYGDTETQLTVGVTFKPTDFLTFEATTGVGNTNNNVNVFSTGTNGLFNFGSILISLKF